VFAPVLTKPGTKVRVLGGEGVMGVRVRRGLSVFIDIVSSLSYDLSFEHVSAFY
jgi:hypothetical protein